MNILLPQLQFVVGPEHNGMLMTPEEFDETPEWDENYIYELIHGVLIVNPIPSALERRPNDELGRCLGNYRELHPQGSALNLTLYEHYVPSSTSRRRADRLIWAGLGRIPDWKHELPTIAVEFVSATARDRRRDYEEKRREYMALGIKEYWIIDRFRRQMTVIRKQAKKTQEIMIQEHEVYRTPLLPGFELPLARLLAVADEMDQPQVRRPKPRGRKGR